MNLLGYMSSYTHWIYVKHRGLIMSCERDIASVIHVRV